MAAMLTYETDPKAKCVVVRMFRKKIGKIVSADGGYRYETGKYHGSTFSTVAAVKRDIETEDEHPGEAAHAALRS